MPPHQQPQLPQEPSERVAHLASASGFMDRDASPGTSNPNGQDAQQDGAQGASKGEGEKRITGGGKKKNYQRYPKPPYSYLAMIAMVIQRSEERRLTLSKILKEITVLFPFFKGTYKGWRDSVRHNLSSYDCFVKILKDPAKPHGKGNYWTVEPSRVPLELLKRQNTAVSRKDETVFAQDLSPFILKDCPPGSEMPLEFLTSHPPVCSGNPSPPQDNLLRSRLDSSFAIDSLLHSFRPNSASGNVDVVTGDRMGLVARPHASEAPRPHYTSSAHSVTSSSTSPASTISSSSDERKKGVSRKRFPPDGDVGYSDYQNCSPPLHKARRREAIAHPWELPTSYSKYAPPNVVAPPSVGFSGNPLAPLPSRMPIYSYGSTPVPPAPSHFLSHGYWPILPTTQVSVPGPHFLMDLDNMLQSVPPNKSVFDVLVPPNQNSHPHYQLANPYTLQNGASFTRYHQY